MLIGLGKCVGENIWNRRKRSRALRYGDCVLTGYCVRGDSIKGGKGREGSGGIVRHLLESLDDESEGKTI